MATTALVGLWAQTSIHTGAGSSIDGIDLPIQREAHNGWPCVFGSAVKGALRAKAEDLWWFIDSDGKRKISNSVYYVFGPDSDSDKASEHAGALMVGDARLLLLPVRSLTGYFKWVTCPALLNRLRRDAARLKIKISYGVSEVSEIAKAIANTEDTKTALQLNSNGNDLFLEEYRFKTQKYDDLKIIVEVLRQLSGIEVTALNEQLVIVDNDMFTHLCQYATPVNPHIAINNATKTTKTGALWYEETLPPETVFYLGLAANSVRADKPVFNSKEVEDSKAETVLKSIIDIAEPYLQIGGNETVGMGWCEVTLYKGA